ncbi:ABC transporter substrate-binding protein [Fodinicurvata sp. EGI_FJ10296]|uniref:ABC transporter substrate-binding protein n=1 Tax=Fodinicurvata sp. EGI_FJ10296 TaxID=3231908 RepID=UPI003453411B
MMNRQIKAALAATTILVASSATALADDPQYGGTMHLKWGTLDTADFHRHTGTISLTHPFVETLTSISADGQPRGMLAENWTISDDGLIYTFDIREGVLFHNGREMTAADVLANFERIKREVSGGWLTSALDKVASMEAPDDTTFVVTLSEPFAPFLNLIAEAWIIAPETPGWDETITQPIGTGPFTFDSWVPQLEIVGERFDDYWMDGQPYLDGVVFDVREIADASLALRAGDFHAATIPLSAVSAAEDDPEIGVQFRADTSWYFLSFNNRNPNPPFDNVRVREAVAHAMDRKTLMTIHSGRFAIDSNQMVTEDSFYYDETIAAEDRHGEADLDRARAILEEEGVDPSAVTVQMVSEPNSRLSGPVVQTLQQLGFQIDNRAYDDLGFQRRLSEYDWDIFPGGSGPRNDIFLRYVRFMSDGPNPGLWGGVQDAELDAMITDAISTADPQESRRHYLEAWQRIMDNYYTVVLGHAPAAYGIRSEVNDFTVAFNTSAHRVDGGLAFAWLSQ